MEKKNAAAATLQKKKTTINKAKVKKTIKNTLCRPDPVFWFVYFFMFVEISTHFLQNISTIQ